MIQASADLLRKLPRSRACQIVGLNRGSGYRWQTPGPQDPGGSAPARPRRGRPPVEDAALRQALEAQVLAYPRGGRLQLTYQLRRAGWTINPKRVRRIMREEGWLRVVKRRTVRTTHSDHAYARYPNLLAMCGWRDLTAPDQAWGADLTYVRLGEGFCYLAVVLDLYSRKLLGWDVSASLEAEGALAALEMALTTRPRVPGRIHHSDRGVQYACGAYVQRLQEAEMQISMCATGEPRENAPVERLIRTIKEEEVDLQEYRSLAEARTSLGHFIAEVYNGKRLHSALGYRPPTEFEALFAASLSS